MSEQATETLFYFPNGCNAEAGSPVLVGPVGEGPKRCGRPLLLSWCISRMEVEQLGWKLWKLASTGDASVADGSFTHRTVPAPLGPFCSALL